MGWNRCVYRHAGQEQQMQQPEKPAMVSYMPFNNMQLLGGQ
jgi:hypothetical protein